MARKEPRDMPAWGRELYARVIGIENEIYKNPNSILTRLMRIETQLAHIEKAVSRHDKFFYSIFALLLGIILKLFVG